MSWNKDLTFLYLVIIFVDSKSTSLACAFAPLDSKTSPLGKRFGSSRKKSFLVLICFTLQFLILAIIAQIRITRGKSIRLTIPIMYISAGGRGADVQSKYFVTQDSIIKTYDFTIEFMAKYV